MVSSRTWLLTVITMIAFAANSILCREALRHTGIDAATFTLVRIVSGALMLTMLVRLRNSSAGLGGNWISAVSLVLYAASFSFAYLSLPAGTGALILFGAVQSTMIGRGLMLGEHVRPIQVLGLALALVGLVLLVLPGLSAPPLLGAALMALAGLSWGVYSLRGRRETDALAANAGNFLRAVPIAALVCLPTLDSLSPTAWGLFYAVLSGALASGLGYALWYRTLPGLPATIAETVQLSVPVLTALSGTLILNEPLTMRLVLSSAAILGGIALVVSRKRI